MAGHFQDNCGSVASYLRSAASSSGLPRDLDDVTIPDFPDVSRSESPTRTESMACTPFLLASVLLYHTGELFVSDSNCLLEATRMSQCGECEAFCCGPELIVCCASVCYFCDFQFLQ